MQQGTNHNSRKLQSEMRDLLGFIRMENAVLMDQGQLTLRGLYLQKMMMLKDLEDQAELLADENSETDVVDCLRLLKQVHKELKINTVHHVEALKVKSSRDAVNSVDDYAMDTQGGRYDSWSS